MARRRSTTATKTRYSWPPILDAGRTIVDSYDTGVTLRQLFYRLVTGHHLPNLQSYYRRLSSKTAEGRRAGTFPDLLDRTGRIERPLSFTDPDQAREFLRNLYRRDRTEGQEWTTVLGVEKAGMSAQLDSWFTDPLGIPHVPLGGFAPQSLCDEVARDVIRQGRPAVLLYAGDFDPSGVSMDVDFANRVGAFDKVIRVALNEEQIEEHGLVENPDPEAKAKAKAKAKVEQDPRAAAFIRRYGELRQFEVDALPPDTLRDLYRTALDGIWDADAYDDVIEREDAERDEL